MNINQDIVIVYNERRSLYSFYNNSLEKGISFLDNFVNSSPYLRTLIDNYGHLNIYDNLSKEEKDELNKNTVQKVKINTIHEGLIEVKAIQDTIYTRYKEILYTYFNTEEQIELVSSMINNLVLKSKKISLIAKTLEDKTMTNTKYFEEKFYYIFQMIEDGVWEISGFDYIDTGTYCELGHEIKKVVYIKDRDNDFVLQFGISCIEDVISLNNKQKNEIDNMFSTYRRYIIEYTYMLETLENSLVSQNSLLFARQCEVLKLIRGTISLDKSNSIHQFKRTNVRREMDSASNITIQHYDNMIYLLERGVPLPQEYIDDLLKLNNKETGFEELYIDFRRLLPESNRFIQYLYRCLLGQYGPSITVKENGFLPSVKDLREDFPRINILGYPMSVAELTKFLDNYKEFTISKVTPVDDQNFAVAVNSGVSIDSVMESIRQFLQDLTQFDIKENFILGYKNSFGLSKEVSISTIIKHQLGLKKSMKVTTLINKYSELKYGDKTNDVMYDVMNYDIIKDSYSSIRTIRVYHYKAVVSVEVQSGILKNVLTDINFDLSSLERYVLDNLSRRYPDLVNKYKIRLYQTTGLNQLYRTFDDYKKPFDEKKKLRISPFFADLLKTGTTSTLLGLDYMKERDSDQPRGTDLYEAVTSIMKSYASSQKEEHKERLSKLDESEIKQAVTMEEAMLNAKYAQKAFDLYKDTYTDNNLKVSDDSLKDLLNCNNTLIKYSCATLDLLALKTLIDNKEIVLTEKEEKDTRFILSKVLPFVQTTGRILSAKQAKFGSEDVRNILRDRVAKTIN